MRSKWDQRLDKKHVHPRCKAPHHRFIFRELFAWEIRTPLFKLVGDTFSDRKGITEVVTQSALLDAFNFNIRAQYGFHAR